MSVESLMAASGRLGVSVEALAALGAELRLRQEGLEADARIRSLLHDVVTAVEPQLLDGIDAEAEAATLALIQTIFRQAIDLMENPARIPGWRYEDPLVVQSQGQLSRLIVRGIETLAAQRPDLDATLRRSGTFLDVGTGVGWLAIEAARSWPALQVIGVDPWEPALALARQNLAKSGVADRVVLRLQSVEQLEEEATVALAWLPGPFIAAEFAHRALQRVRHALMPGGWLIFGLIALPSEVLVSPMRA
jgi:precorrin-6B methylase 2